MEHAGWKPYHWASGPVLRARGRCSFRWKSRSAAVIGSAVLQDCSSMRVRGQAVRNGSWLLGTKSFYSACLGPSRLMQRRAPWLTDLTMPCPLAAHQVKSRTEIVLCTPRNRSPGGLLGRAGHCAAAVLDRRPTASACGGPVSVYDIGAACLLIPHAIVRCRVHTRRCTRACL